MDEILILGRDDDRRVVKNFLAQYDVPAYVRRAQQVEAALEQLLARCRQQREEWLPLVRARIGVLRALAGDWPVLRPLLQDEAQLEKLATLHEQLQPPARRRQAPRSSLRLLRRALTDLCLSIEHFNARWEAFLPNVDRRAINELREAYNRYYLLEKECALRSARLARQGFLRLEPLTVEELQRVLPPLPVVQLAH